jgi:hypothetical protein
LSDSFNLAKIDICYKKIYEEIGLDDSQGFQLFKMTTYKKFVTDIFVCPDVHPLSVIVFTIRALSIIVFSCITLTRLSLFTLSRAETLNISVADNDIEKNKTLDSMTGMSGTHVGQ